MEISYGLAESIGHRSRMEDTYVLRDEPEANLFSAEVYDGHGGSAAAVKAAEFLTPFLLSSIRTQGKARRYKPFLADLVRKAYLATDEYILAQGIESGAVAATLHIVGDRFCAANVGDARVVISRDEGASQLTEDHKPDVPAERGRIERFGGSVVRLDVARLQGTLAVSRAFGDPGLRPYLTAEPRLCEGLLGRENSHAVVACDGIWDVLSPDEAIGIVRRHGDPQKAAEAIEKGARARASLDNITVLVLDLRQHTARLRRKGMTILSIMDQGT